MPLRHVSGLSDPPPAAMPVAWEGGVAYREVDVVEIKEVLRRWLAGQAKSRCRGACVTGPQALGRS